VRFRLRDVCGTLLIATYAGANLTRLGLFITRQKSAECFCSTMGGGQTVNIGFSHLDAFHSIGVFSAGAGNNDSEKQYPDLLKDAGATNKKVKVIWICAGDKDFALTGAQRLDKILTDHGVLHTFVETPGVHEWKVWRYSLNQFAPLLFN
jgi:enterochelin esterase-like enzyme